MNIYKKTILAASILLNLNVAAAIDGFNSTQSMAGGAMMVSSLALSMEADDQGLTHALSQEKYLATSQQQKLIGSTVKYEAIVDGQKVSIIQKLANLDDVAKFDARRIEGLRLSRIKDFSVTTRRMVRNGRLGLIFGIVGVPMFFNGTGMVGDSVMGDLELTNVLVDQ